MKAIVYKIKLETLQDYFSLGKVCPQVSGRYKFAQKLVDELNENFEQVQQRIYNQAIDDAASIVAKEIEYCAAPISQVDLYCAKRAILKLKNI